MKITNNTKRILKLCFGDTHKEEPEAMVILKVGWAMDLDDCPNTDISIQEMEKK